MQMRLTTTGRQTGEARTVTLYAFETPDGALVITASLGGSARNPAWVHNLRANRARPSRSAARNDRSLRERRPGRSGIGSGRS